MEKRYVLIQERYTPERVSEIIKAVIEDVQSRNYDRYSCEVT